MAVSGLIDAGPIIAILDRNDHWHAACKESVRQFQPPLVTSSAVLTEVFYLVRRARIDLELAWSFVRSGLILLGQITDGDLPHLHALMSKYADHPMDFADATLVHLAQRESVSKILTIDHDDFETYRIDGRKRFEIVPGRRH